MPLSPFVSPGPRTGNRNLPYGSLGSPAPYKMTPDAWSALSNKAHAFKNASEQAAAAGRPAPMAPNMQDPFAGPLDGMNPLMQGGVPGMFEQPERLQPSAPADPFRGYMPGTRSQVDPFQADPRKRGHFAAGGEVEGPGGPKDDLVPAMLSDGEFVMPAEAVEFYGLDKLNKMKMKAKEGLAEMDQAQGAKPPPPIFPMAPVPHMAEGGFVNPYANDPVAYARRQYEAANAQPQADGIVDMGGGQKTLANQYGTGYAAQPGGAGYVNTPAMFNDQGNAMRVTPGQGMAPVPDFIPAGPWSNGALPYDNQAQRQNIDFVSKQMEQGADARRWGDTIRDVTAAAMIPRGAEVITVPDARPDFGAGRGKASSGEERYGAGKFMAPWEKDAAARASQADVDRMEGRPEGMRETDWRRFKKTPQGIEYMAEAAASRAKGPINQALPVLNADGSPSTSHQMVNGQIVPINAAADGTNLPKRLKELDALINDKKQPIHIRELARRERESAARSAIAGTGTGRAPSTITQVDPKTMGNETFQWDPAAGEFVPARINRGAGVAPAPASGSAGAGSPAAARIAALRAAAGLK